MISLITTLLFGSLNLDNISMFQASNESKILRSRCSFIFAEIFQKIGSKTQPFIYCGRLEDYTSYDKDTSNPVTIFFKSVDYNFEENKHSDLGRKIYFLEK